MRIFVKAKPKSRFEGVRKIDDKNYEVSVKAPPEQGKANMAIKRSLARHFAVRESRVRIILGSAARRKLVEILE